MYVLSVYGNPFTRGLLLSCVIKHFLAVLTVAVVPVGRRSWG